MSTWRKISSWATNRARAPRPLLTCGRWAPASVCLLASTSSSPPPLSPAERPTLSCESSQRSSRKQSECPESFYVICTLFCRAETQAFMLIVLFFPLMVCHREMDDQISADLKDEVCIIRAVLDCVRKCTCCWLLDFSFVYFFNIRMKSRRMTLMTLSSPCLLSWQER